MPLTQDIIIKTKYQTLDECVRDCLDINEEYAFLAGKQKGIIGRIDEKSFALSSTRGLSSRNFLFTGQLEEREDGIYMVGRIAPKKWMFWSTVLSIIPYAFVYYFTSDMLENHIGANQALLLFCGLYIVGLLVSFAFNTLHKDLLRKVGV